LIQLNYSFCRLNRPYTGKEQSAAAHRPYVIPQPFQ